MAAQKFQALLNILKRIHKTDESRSKILEDLASISEKDLEEIEQHRIKSDAVIADLVMFSNESVGIAGWHQNGDVAEWKEFDFLKDANQLLTSNK